MRFRTLVRRTGVRLLLLGVVAAALVTGAGNAQAATTGVTPSGGIAVHLMPVSGSRVAPQDFLSCQIAGPIVTYTYATGELDWYAGDQCPTTLRMQGSTKLFVWGSSNAYAYGSRYDSYYSSASSTGQVYSIFSGQWGVTINVLFFLPPGWTTNPSYACSWFDTAHTQLQCSVTTGPVQTR